MCRNLSATDPILDRGRQLLHHGKTPRDPSRAAVETSRQLFLAPTFAPAQLRQQPSLLQRRIACCVTQITLQHQGFGFAQIPQCRLHCVLLEPVEYPQPFVAVDDHIPIRRLNVAHNDDWLLLTIALQRAQKTALTPRVLRPQLLIAPFQLVKLKLHGTSCRRGRNSPPRHDRACTQIEPRAIWSCRQRFS